MVVLDILVVRNVSAYRGVSRFGDVAWAFIVSFFGSSAVDRLFNYFPTEVVIRHLTLGKWCRCWDSRHDWCEGKEHVVEIPCMVDIHALVGDLETGASHTEVHGIHVDFAWVWLAITHIIHICLFVLEKRYCYMDFFLSPLVDWLGQAQKSGMRSCTHLWKEFLVGLEISLLITLLSIFFEFLLVFWDIWNHTVIHSHYWAGCCRNQRCIISICGQELCHKLSPSHIKKDSLITC